MSGVRGIPALTAAGPSTRGWQRADAHVEFVARRLLEEDAEATAQGNTITGAQRRLSVALRRLGYTLLVDLRRTPAKPLADAYLKRMATRYDDHPDFSEWWRPT